MHDQLINNLNERFANRKSVLTMSELEDLLMSSTKGNCTRYETLFRSEGFARYQTSVDKELLKSEFRCVSMTMKGDKVASFSTLVTELKKHDLECL